MAGGVAANTRLRAALGARLPSNVYYAPAALCTDNGAMVAFAGYLRLAAGQHTGLEIETRARWPLDDLAAVDARADG
jgi:N6-L-threonylcarbamoyladenine synthase